MEALKIVNSFIDQCSIIKSCFTSLNPQPLNPASPLKSLHFLFYAPFKSQYFVSALTP